MPRRSNNGRAKLKHPMSFRKMSDLLGLHPIQRVKIAKYIREIKKGSEQNLKS